MIIWGSTVREIVQDTGLFHCPNCGGQREGNHVVNDEKYEAEITKVAHCEQHVKMRRGNAETHARVKHEQSPWHPGEQGKLDVGTALARNFPC